MIVALLGAFVLAAANDPREDFQRAVEADLAVAEASALAATRPAEARQLYRYALELAPDDADIYLSAARFERAQGKIDAALKYLELGTAKAPAHAQVPYERALLLMDQKRDDEAKQVLLAYRAVAPHDLRPAYWLGLFALQADQSNEAFAYFEEAQKGEGEPAAYARSYYAILAAARGEKEAASYAARALQTAPTEPLRQRLSLLAEGAVFEVSTTRGERYLPWFNTQAQAGIEYDTNAALGVANFADLNARAAQAALDAGQDPANAATYQPPVGATRLVESARAIFRPVASERFTLEADASFVNANIVTARNTILTSGRSLSSYDYGGPMAAVRFYSRLGSGKTKVELGLDANFRDLWTGTYQSHFLTGWGTRPSVGLIFAPRHRLDAIGAFEFRDFVSGSPPNAQNSPYDRDAFYFSGGLSYNLPVKWFDFTLSGAYDQENAGRKLTRRQYVQPANGAAPEPGETRPAEERGAHYFLHGMRGRLSVRFTFKDKLVANAYGGVNLRWFPFAFPARNERRFEVGAGFRYYFLPYLAAGASVGYMNNAADNVASGTPYPEFTYQGLVVSVLTVSGQY